MKKMTSNDELFAKADFEASLIEERLERALSTEEYSEFVLWYIKNSQKQPWLRSPNPLESGTME
jgi:hypothetical protein